MDIDWFWLLGGLAQVRRAHLQISMIIFIHVLNPCLNILLFDAFFLFQAFHWIFLMPHIEYCIILLSF